MTAGLIYRAPNFRDGHGQFEGWGYMSTAGASAGGNAVGALAIEYWSKGGAAFHGFSVNGKNDQSGDPQVDAMIAKARVEQNTEQRRALVFDIQRYLAKATYALSPPGGHGAHRRMALPRQFPRLARRAKQLSLVGRRDETAIQERLGNSYPPN